MESPFVAFKAIRAFVFDVDGVMTDARVQVQTNGELLRTVSIRDGYAVKHALQNGYRVAIITGGQSEGVRLRFKALGLDDYYSGVEQKSEVFAGYMKRHQLNREQVLYMGDDIPDLGPMSLAGIACAPADACPEVLAKADYISHRNGGDACVRDVIERVMKLNSCWIQA